MAKLKSLFAQAPTELKVFEEPEREALSYSDLDIEQAGEGFDKIGVHLDGHIGNYNDDPRIDYDKIAEELSVHRGGVVTRKDAKDFVYSTVYGGPITGSPTLDDFLKHHYNPLGVTRVVYPGWAVPVVLAVAGFSLFFIILAGR